jgi:hypothetical protein
MKKLLLQAATFAMSLGLLAPLSAHAVITADEMTCEQAIKYYAKHKRIYVVANGKDIVPLYGMTPVGESASLICKGHGKTKVSYWTETLDNDDCVFAVYCQ